MIHKNPKIPKLSKMVNKSWKIWKSLIFSFFFFLKKKIFAEDAIWPELASPARCRILGGYPERDGGRSRTEEILVFDIALYAQYW